MHVVSLPVVCGGLQALRKLSRKVKVAAGKAPPKGAAGNSLAPPTQALLVDEHKSTVKGACLEEGEVRGLAGRLWGAIMVL